MSTREHILDEAERRMLTAGPSAFSFYDLADALGIRHTAIHYHFHSKDDLLAALIERACHRVVDLERETSGQENPVRRMSTFIQVYLNNARRDLICMISSVTALFPQLGEAVQDAVRSTSQRILDLLTSIVRDGQRDGSFKADKTAHVMALQIIANLMTGIQMRRVLGDDVLKSLVDGIWRDLGARRPRSTSSSEHHA